MFEQGRPKYKYKFYIQMTVHRDVFL